MSYKKIMLTDKKKAEAGIRLNKYLSDAGVCSRREADRLIEQGRVLVNGKTAVMGQRISDSDKVVYEEKELKLIEQLELIAFHKPVGIECTADRNNKDNVIDYIHYGSKIFYVGRLDKASCGLLLLTNDGDLANQIAKAVNRHEKEYIVKVNKSITEDFIKRMEDGVEILGTVTRKCQVKKVKDDTFNIILTQGLNRQIRRMCEALSYKVISLKRIRVMSVKLGELKEGQYRRVTEQELEKILKAVKGDRDDG